MSLFRKGLTPMPISYIERHQRLAMTELEAIRGAFGIVVERTYLQTDGWFDGFQVLHVQAKTAGGRSFLLQWSDGSMAFMKRCDSGGWGALREEDLR
jgi:hypothetical protein